VGVVSRFDIANHQNLAGTVLITGVTWLDTAP
jgi:hypothetical protein